MFAIISYKNNQYKVKEGQIIDLPMTEYDEKSKNITFDSVLLLASDDKVSIGTPEVKGAKVDAEILSMERTKKVKVFKFRAKKRYKKTAGSRTDYLKVKINKIEFK